MKPFILDLEQVDAGYVFWQPSTAEYFSYFFEKLSRKCPKMASSFIKLAWDYPSNCLKFDFEKCEKVSDSVLLSI